MNDARPRLKVGDHVKVRPGGAIERSRWDKRDVVGTVVAAEEIPAFGLGVRIQWPGEEIDWAFQNANLFDLVVGVK